MALDLTLGGDDFSFLDGYDSYGDGGAPWVYTPGGTAYGAKVTTTYPAQPVVGVGYTTQTEVQRILYTNKGWNAWARSVDPLIVGNFFNANVATNVQAVFFGVGEVGLDGQSVAAYNHGILITQEGVSIREAGQTARTVKAAFLNTSDIKIFRQPDNTIGYVMTTAGETLVFFGENSIGVGWLADMYIYGYLYNGGDIVEDAAFISGQIHSASV